jgi:hypothetical protein
MYCCNYEKEMSVVAFTQRNTIRIDLETTARSSAIEKGNATYCPTARHGNRHLLKKLRECMASSYNYLFFLGVVGHDQRERECKNRLD